MTKTPLPRNKNLRPPIDQKFLVKMMIQSIQTNHLDMARILVQQLHLNVSHQVELMNEKLSSLLITAIVADFKRWEIGS